MRVSERRKLVDEIAELLRDSRERLDTAVGDAAPNDDVIILAAEAAANVVMAFCEGYEAGTE